MMSRWVTGALASLVFLFVFFVVLMGDQILAWRPPARPVAKAPVAAQPSELAWYEPRLPERGKGVNYVLDPPPGMTDRYDTHRQQNAALVALTVGRHISPEEARDADNDGPVEVSLNNMAMTTDDRGETIACMAARNSAVTRHIVFVYSPTSFVVEEPTLYAWIASGCAKAVKEHGETMRRVDALGRIVGLIPSGERYLSTRRFWGQQLASARRMPRARY